MNKQILLISDLIIIFAVVAGFTISIYRDTTSYQQLAEKHLANVVSLADTAISDHINTTMSRPVMVSKTMANDEFLKSWLAGEPGRAGNADYLKQLYGYLKAYQLKYGYTTVFCVSDRSGNYYYQDGLNKTISASDAHDVWYYNFRSSGHEYDLEVDTNQANHDSITVFVNFRVEDGAGRYLGVIGVGLKVSSIEDTIRTYERTYGMSVYIANIDGASTSYKGSTDIFVSADKLREYSGIRNEIRLSKSVDSDMQWFTEDGQRKCLITRYDPTLGWFLVLEMTTDSIERAFTDRIVSNVLFMILSLLACILVTTIVFFNFNRRIVAIENVDDLTGLPNRKLFARQYHRFVRKRRGSAISLFMLDVDNFKEINDRHDHLFGNAVLSSVADKLRAEVGSRGFAARWGGDEFIGVLDADPDSAREIMERFMESLRQTDFSDGCRVTVSVGIAAAGENSGMDKAIREADESLYLSKQNGRNRVTVYGS